VDQDREAPAERPVLITAANWIGDALMSLPALQAFRREQSEFTITLLTRPFLVPLWEMGAAADRLLPVERTASLLHTVRQLRMEGFERAYLFPNSFRSAWLPFAAGVPRRIGFRGHWRRALLTESVPMPAGHQQLECRALLGIQGTLEPPRLMVPAEAVGSLKERLPPTDKRVVLLPGAARGPAKRWPPPHFIRLGRALVERGVQVVLSGAEADVPDNGAIAAAIGPEVKDLTGQTGLKEWAALLQSADGVVCNDSGGMHLAAAVGTPLVALFGTTAPEKTGPLTSRCVILKKSGISDRAVRRDSWAAQSAMERIGVDEVLEALDQLKIFTG